MYNVAIAGATGAVGQEMLEILDQRDFPVKNLTLLASPRSRGKTMTYRGEEIEIEVLAERSFDDIDVVLASCGSGIIKEHADRIVADGAVIVDNSSAFRYDPDIPLVVPEINAEAAEDHAGIIANPNCSTSQLVMVLGPVHRAYGIKRVVVSTYQATSGAGGQARQECWEQTRALVNDQPIPRGENFPHQIAFNSIPLIGEVLPEDNDYTKEEMKMVWETRKIIGDDSIEVSPTAIRIPVLNCHGESVNVETEEPCPMEELREMLSDFPGVEVQDDPNNDEYPTMLGADGRDPVYVGRLRNDPSLDNGFNCWIVADNLRKGAALNTIQIAEVLVEKGLLTEKQHA